MTVEDPLKEIWPPSLLLAVTVVSWYFRPASRRLNSLAQFAQA
jgi:hypothetical protein